MWWTTRSDCWKMLVLTRLTTKSEQRYYPLCMRCKETCEKRVIKMQQPLKIIWIRIQPLIMIMMTKMARKPIMQTMLRKTLKKMKERIQCKRTQVLRPTFRVKSCQGLPLKVNRQLKEQGVVPPLIERTKLDSDLQLAKGKKVHRRSGEDRVN